MIRCDGRRSQLSRG